MPISTRPITYEDSLTMPVNRLEEVVNGESRIMPPASDRHGHLLRKLTRILEDQLPSGTHVVLGAEFGLGIQRRPVLTYRIPDRMVFRTAVLHEDAREKAPDDPYIWKTPELIVECLSPANRKGPVEELLADYSRIGVPEVWLLDPQRPLWSGYLYEGANLSHQQGVERGTAVAFRLPGVAVTLDDLWEAFDKGGLGL